jgi:hypothetical protein
VKRSLVLAAAFCAIALTLTGCGGGSSSSSSSSSAAASSTAATSTGVADPALAPPPQHNPAGLKDVVFDPCTKLDDSTVSTAGLDPTSRQRGSDVTDANAGYTMLSCTFNSKTAAITVDSTNLTFDGYKGKYKADQMTAATVAGHSAVQFVDQGVCVVALPSSDGVFDVQASPTSQGGDPCAGVQAIASTLAGAL